MSKAPPISAQPRQPNATKNDLLLYYQNLGGINTMLSEYAQACSAADYDLYAFTETWLNENTNTRQLFDNSYTVHRQDRSSLNSSKRSGGGVMLAIRSHYKSRSLTPPNCTSVEQVWAALPLQAKTLFICVIYLPPDRTNDTRIIDDHLQSLNWILEMMGGNDEILIIGDFNLPSINWTACSRGYFYPDSNINSITARLLDGYCIAGLVQLNGSINSNGRLLDLCFHTSASSLPCRVDYAPAALVKSTRHHPELLTSICDESLPMFMNPVEPVSYDFGRGDFPAMNLFLDSMDWNELFSGLTADRAALALSNVLQYCIDQFIPKKVYKLPNKPAWSNNELKRLKSAKRAALRLYSRHRQENSDDIDELRRSYSMLNQQYKQLNALLYANHQQQLQDQLKSNPKSFWSYVNSQRKETGLPSTMSDGSSVASTAEDIAELFTSQFKKVFSSNNINRQELAAAVEYVPELPSIGLFPSITMESVVKAGNQLKHSFNPGPDGIPSALLKNCIATLAEPLAAVYNLSISTGSFPECWKDSFVFPVFKKGDKQVTSNYRGIAALCATSKLFEILVLDFMTFKLSRLIAPEQHGFMSKRSTCSNLVTYTSYIIEEIEKGHQTDAIYTDFSAAFDKIDHRIAIAKYKRLGIHGNLLKWLGSYLTGRRMSVKIGQHISSTFAVTSGVPQGSHLGPFLFLLYLNDIHALLECRKLSFADDFKLFYAIVRPDDTLFLQQQLDLFATWCQRNKMALNASKCFVITFTRKLSIISHNYNLLGTSINRELCVKDLGVMLDSKLTFKNHVSYVVSKASSLLGFVFRFGKYFRDVYCLKSLYCSLVRSTLEYCSVVWSPFYMNSIQRIEAIQRKFIRFALRFLPWNDPFNLPSYESRCRLINLDSLEARRNISKAMFISDLLTSNMDCAELLSQARFNIPQYRLRTYLPLNNPTSRTNYGSNLPFKVMCRVFNQCYDVFDFNLSRSTLKDNFRRALC